MQVVEHGFKVLRASSHLMQHQARQAWLLDVNAQVPPDQEAQAAAQAVQAGEAFVDVTDQRLVHATHHFIKQVALGWKVRIDESLHHPHLRGNLADRGPGEALVEECLARRRQNLNRASHPPRCPLSSGIGHEIGSGWIHREGGRQVEGAAHG